LSQALANRQTVFVDFTADWCWTCKWNETYRLNVAETKTFIEGNEIVTLKADMTHGSPEADALKRRLGGSSIPFYAVFPAATPYEPIVFDGPIGSVDYVLARFEQALSKRASPSPRVSTASIREP
jgi:thiol:disulfide interchange protein DsbD